MSDQPDTDRATVVPPAAPLTGEELDPDQPAPSDVFPIGGAMVDHLEPTEEQDD